MSPKTHRVKIDAEVEGIDYPRLLHDLAERLEPMRNRIFGMESLTFGYREELTDEDRPEYGHDPRTGKYLKQVITAHTVVEFSVE